MKALSTLKSAIDHSSFVGIIALVSLLPVLAPEFALAAELQTSQSQKVLVFQIKDPAVNINQTVSNQTNNPTLAYSEVVNNDPLHTDLQAYLKSYNSPLADYTDQLLQKDNWDYVLAISFVESNMGQHHYYYNSSGIGGQEYLRKYHNYGEWIDDMSQLLTQRYSGWSIDKMNGIYVQPKSVNWGNGAKKILTELDGLKQIAELEKQQQIADSQSKMVPNEPLETFPQLALLTK